MLNDIIIIIFFLIVCLAISIVYTKESVRAIICLILIYTLVSIMLIIVGCEFLGLLIIIVYVGAIAILFLFIIVMLNLRVIEETEIMGNHVSMIFFILLNFLLLLYLIIDDNLLDSYNLIPMYLDYTVLYTSLRLTSNINLIGFVLYNEVFFAVIISGILLILSLIGSIAMSVNFKRKNLYTKKIFKYRNINYLNNRDTLIKQGQNQYGRFW